MSAPSEATPSLNAVESARTPTASARRKLAANVVCMFPEDREPIVQPRRRGRLPRGVSLIRNVPRIRVGVLADIAHSSRAPENVGARVLVTRYESRGTFRFECKSLDRDLTWFAADGSGEHGRDRVVWFKEADLRRVWTGVLPKRSPRADQG